MSGGDGTARAVPFHCPFCGDEDLRPHEEGHGTWLCTACRRAFALRFLGLVLPGRPDTGPAPAAHSTAQTAQTVQEAR